MNQTIYKFDQRRALDVMMAVARGSGIAFEKYESQIEGVLTDVYADGVFLASYSPGMGSQQVSAVGLMGMNAESALAYLLARCKQRGIWEIFVKGPITKLVNGLYASGMMFVAGSGVFGVQRGA